MKFNFVFEKVTLKPNSAIDVRSSLFHFTLVTLGDVKQASVFSLHILFKPMQTPTEETCRKHANCCLVMHGLLRGEMAGDIGQKSWLWRLISENTIPYSVHAFGSSVVPSLTKLLFSEPYMYGVVYWVIQSEVLDTTGGVHYPWFCHILCHSPCCLIADFWAEFHRCVWNSEILSRKNGTYEFVCLFALFFACMCVCSIRNCFKWMKLSDCRSKKSQEM